MVTSTFQVILRGEGKGIYLARLSPTELCKMIRSDKDFFPVSIKSNLIALEFRTVDF
jgi:hypothetical protein